MTTLDDQLRARLNITDEQLAAFCQKWKIVEFALFGSVLTDEFRPDSDVDVMVTFADDALWSLFDIVGMEDELSAVLKRKVEFAEKSAVEKSRNKYRRASILNSVRQIYAA